MYLESIFSEDTAEQLDKAFVEECPGNNMNHHTLLRIIKKIVAAGNWKIILTDKKLTTNFPDMAIPT